MSTAMAMQAVPTRTTPMRAIIWREWHEHRNKYLRFWITFHAPIVFFAILVGMTSYGRIPFADLSDATVMKYLPLSLVQTLFSETIFLVLTGYLAVSTFAKEIDNHTLFFLFEQPLPRRQYVLLKMLNGAAHVALATWCSILLLPVAAYVMMLISGKVTFAGSSAAFWMVMAAAVRCAVWASLITVAGFTISVVISAVIPGWWVAAVCSIVVTVLLIGLEAGYFDFIPADTAEPMSVGFGFGTGNAPWVTVSRALKASEVAATGAFRWMPMLTAVLIIVVCSGAAVALYERKELK